MGNVLDKFYRENENTHFIIDNFIPKIAQFIIPKNVVETEGPLVTSQHGAYALRAGLARLHALIRMHTPTRSGTNMPARARAYRPISNTYCFSTATMIRERASVSRYTSNGSLLFNGCKATVFGRVLKACHYSQ
jgi:hypothetical protein